MNWTIHSFSYCFYPVFLVLMFLLTGGISLKYKASAMYLKPFVFQVFIERAVSYYTKARYWIQASVLSFHYPGQQWAVHVPYLHRLGSGWEPKAEVPVGGESSRKDKRLVAVRRMAGDWSGVEFGWSFKTQTHLSQSLCSSFYSKAISNITKNPHPSLSLVLADIPCHSRVPGFVLCRASPCFSDVYIWISLTVGVLDFRRTLHCGVARSRASFPSLCQGQDSWESSRWHSLSPALQSSSLGNGTRALGASRRVTHQIPALRSTEMRHCCAVCWP